jgi:fructan beta-fructosidase
MKSQVSLLLLLLGLGACGRSQDNQKTNADTTASEQTAAVSASPLEAHRPRFHFTPPAGWMNDPNGMVYHNGQYHLFYQHNPDSTVWGPMHWGHAVSKDLVRWEHLPIALYPDSLGTIFSGSAVVDVNNTSGLGTAQNPAMVAIFTSHNAEGEKAGRKDFQTQSMAYSTDNGRTWRKYEGNPVLPNPGIRDFRDPKVSWHQPSKQWVMILAVTDHVEIYGSKNLKSWNKLSDFGKTYGDHSSVWECPDLFPLELDGKQKWVMLVSNFGGPNGGSATQYFTGDFDGRNFTPDAPAATTRWLDYGKDNYAGVTWANVPANDGRRLFMGWMSNWQYANVVPTATWRSAMTIARELSLKNTAAGIRVISQPVKELAALRGASVRLPSRTIEGEVDITGEVSYVPTGELRLSFDAAMESKDFGIQLSNPQGQQVRIGYEPAGKRFYVDRTASGKHDFSKDFSGRHYAPRLSKENFVSLHLVIDVASVELFADNGEVVMTEIFFPDAPYNQLKLFSKEGAVKITTGEFTPLKPVGEGSPKVAVNQ